MRIEEQTGGDQAPAMMRLTIRIHEACRMTGIGRSKLYELIKAGDIETIKVGAMTLIPMESLTDFIQSFRRQGSHDRRRRAQY